MKSVRNSSFPSLYFPAFGLNAGRYGHFLRSVNQMVRMMRMPEPFRATALFT